MKFQIFDYTIIFLIGLFFAVAIDIWVAILYLLAIGTVDLYRLLDK